MSALYDRLLLEKRVEREAGWCSHRLATEPTPFRARVKCAERMLMARSR